MCYLMLLLWLFCSFKCAVYGPKSELMHRTVTGPRFGIHKVAAWNYLTVMATHPKLQQ